MGKQSDGATTQEHVDKAKANCFASAVITDQTFEDVPEEVDCPIEVEYIWEWFLELDSIRNNSFSIGPITHQEIESWDRLNKLDIQPFEVRALRAVDKAYLIHNNSQKKEKDGKHTD